MLILGIETTCDETAFAIVRDGFEIVAQCIYSQDTIHAVFGGVVPELASRQHIEIISSLLSETLAKAEMTIDDIDAIAVAKGPGLIGALLVGLHFAKGLAFATGKPLIGVNHIEAHLYAAMMSTKPENLLFPSLGMVISGGHTSLIQIRNIGDYQLIGQTVDDAIGEAFDKVAKMLELPYPGGPQVEKLAQYGNPTAFHFRPSRVKKEAFDFSFSGLKTAVLYTLRGNNLKREDLPSEQEKRDVAASFQHCIFTDVLEKLKLALREYPAKALFLGGGVTQNKTLRAMLEEALSLPIYWPSRELCLDNAAMIAGLAFHKSHTDELLTLEPETRIPFTR